MLGPVLVTESTSVLTLSLSHGLILNPYFLDDLSSFLKMYLGNNFTSHPETHSGHVFSHRHSHAFSHYLGELAWCWCVDRATGPAGRQNWILLCRQPRQVGLHPRGVIKLRGVLGAWREFRELPSKEISVWEIILTGGLEGAGLLHLDNSFSVSRGDQPGWGLSWGRAEAALTTLKAARIRDNGEF